MSPTTALPTCSLGDSEIKVSVVGLGCSNFGVSQLEEAERISRERGLARFVTLQNDYSLLVREIEAEVALACERLNVSILPYFPLAGDLLSGKYRRGAPAQRPRCRDRRPGRAAGGRLGDRRRDAA